MELFFKRLEKSPIFIKYFDYYIAILLGITTVLTAIAAFQGSLWSGNSLSLYSNATAQLNDANTSYLEYINTYTKTELEDLKDDLLYLEWKKMSEKDPDTSYIFSRLTEGLQADLNNDTRNASEEEKEKEQRDKDIEVMYETSQQAYQKAQDTMKRADIANANGDKFTFITVLFAVVLFFGGLSTTTNHVRLRFFFVSIGSVVFIYSLLRFVTLPFPS